VGLLLPRALDAGGRDDRIVPATGDQVIPATSVGQLPTPPPSTLPVVPFKTPVGGAPLPPLPPPKPLYTATWSQSVVATEPLELAVGTAVVLLGASESPLQARAIDDGRQLWTSELAPQGALLAIEGSAVFAAGGALNALDEATGKPRWMVPLGGSSSSLTAHQGRILTAVGHDARAYLLATGQELWRRDIGAAPATPFAFDGTSVFVVTSALVLHALDAATGVPLWQKSLEVPPVSLMAALERVFIGTQKSAVCAYTQTNGARLWCSTPRLPVIGPTATDGTLAYVALRDNTVRGLAPNGTIVRSIALTARPVGGVSLSGNLLVIPTAVGEITLAIAKTGRVAERLRPTGQESTTEPVLENSALSADGTRIATLLVVPGGTRTLALYSRSTPVVPVPAGR
jgi:outer membrane protein assembly factor BamB